MAVLKSKREESRMEAMNTARLIALNTTKMCLKMPKRYTFFGATRASEVARLVYEEIKMANSIYSTNEDSLKNKLHHTEEAICYIQALIGDLSLLEELLRSNPENYNKNGKSYNYEKDMVALMDLISKEIKLLSGYRKYVKEQLNK